LGASRCDRRLAGGGLHPGCHGGGQARWSRPAPVPAAARGRPCARPLCAAAGRDKTCVKARRRGAPGRERDCSATCSRARATAATVSSLSPPPACAGCANAVGSLLCTRAAAWFALRFAQPCGTGSTRTTRLCVRTRGRGAHVSCRVRCCCAWPRDAPVLETGQACAKAAALAKAKGSRVARQRARRQGF